MFYAFIYSWNLNRKSNYFEHLYYILWYLSRRIRIDIHMTGRILALIINFKIAIQKFMHNKTSIYQPLFTMWPFNTACHVNWMRIATLYVLINFHWYTRIAIDVLWWNLKNVGWVQTTFDIGLKYHFNTSNILTFSWVFSLRKYSNGFYIFIR